MTTFSGFYNWLKKHLNINNRLDSICIWYLIAIMLPLRKHSLEEAMRISGIDKSQFSRWLSGHSSEAIFNLKSLSKKQAKKLSKRLKSLSNGALPWKIAIIIDSTLQHRSSLQPFNSKKFNHGKGFVIGHKWTNVILILNDMIIPLPPIAYYSKNYCNQKGLQHKTEHALIVEYFEQLDLREYVGKHSPHEVVVLADSGYDDKKIENAVQKKKWKFIFALKKTRNVKSVNESSLSCRAKCWYAVADFFKMQGWAKWETIHIATNSSKNKRMEFRIRRIFGDLGNVGKVQLICSECKKRPDGRRKYLASNDLKAKVRHIIIGYRLRWEIEIFHKQVKMFMGFEDVATKCFESVVSHVHWVYCAYILMNLSPPGISDQQKSLAEKQRTLEKIVQSKETSKVIQLLTQFDGPKRYKEELQRSLMAA